MAGYGGKSGVKQVAQTLSGYPEGVKFEPTDEQLLKHLAAKLGKFGCQPHPDIDKFIPTIEEEDGICTLHPEELPGSRRDGVTRHYFHRPARVKTTGTRKRRKIHMEADGERLELRWHKTGKTRAVILNKKKMGCKKILVLYVSKGRRAGSTVKEKDVKTNWVMHQYHLGDDHMEKEEEWLVSKMFWQIQPRQSSSRRAPSHIEDEQTVADDLPIGEKWRMADHSTVTFSGGSVRTNTRKVLHSAGKKVWKPNAQKRLQLEDGFGNSTGLTGQGSETCQERSLTMEHDMQSSGGEVAPLCGVYNRPAAIGIEALLRGLHNAPPEGDALSLSDVGSSQEPPDYEDCDAVVSRETPFEEGEEFGGFGWADNRNTEAPSDLVDQEYASLMCHEKDINGLDDIEDDVEQTLGGLRMAPAGDKVIREEKVEFYGGLASPPLDPLVFVDGLICTPPDVAGIAKTLESDVRVCQEDGHERETIGEMPVSGESLCGGQKEQQNGGVENEEDEQDSPFLPELHLSQSLPLLDSQEVNVLCEGLNFSQGDGLLKQLEDEANVGQESLEGAQASKRLRNPFDFPSDGITAWGERAVGTKTAASKGNQASKKKRGTVTIATLRMQPKREAKTGAKPITSFFTRCTAR